MRGQERKPHDARTMAESFGADPERYDRLRPSYPSAMVDVIVAEAPGRVVLDVGCGTGIASRLLQGARCQVLGVEPDPRMATFARGRGLAVEVATFEEWDTAGREYDVVAAGETWHWVDPRVGALRAAAVLRQRGLFAAFWNVQVPPTELGAAFRAAHSSIAPGSPFAKHGSGFHTRILDRAYRGLTDAAAFDKPRVRRFAWEQSYTRAQWLEVIPTFGGHERLDEEQANELADGIGAAIDAHGGRFTMGYETLLLTAVRS